MDRRANGAEPTIPQSTLTAQTFMLDPVPELKTQHSCQNNTYNGRRTNRRTATNRKARDYQRADWVHIIAIAALYQQFGRPEEHRRKLRIRIGGKTCATHMVP